MHMEVVGQLFASLSTEALRELNRDGTVQAWGQKTFRAIKLKISWEQTWDSASLRKEDLSKVLKNFKEQGLKESRQRKRNNEGCESPVECTTHLTPNFFLSVYPIFSLKSPVTPVRSSNNQGARKREKQCPLQFGFFKFYLSAMPSLPPCYFIRTQPVCFSFGPPPCLGPI
jgi:hypothetical protein